MVRDELKSESGDFSPSRPYPGDVRNAPGFGLSGANVRICSDAPIRSGETLGPDGRTGPLESKCCLILPRAPSTPPVPVGLFYFSGGIGQSCRQSFSGEVAAED